MTTTELLRNKVCEVFLGICEEGRAAMTRDEENFALDAIIMAEQIGASRMQEYPDRWAAIMKWSPAKAVHLLKKDCQDDQAQAIQKTLVEQCLTRARKDPYLAEFLTDEVIELMIEAQFGREAT